MNDGKQSNVTKLPSIFRDASLGGTVFGNTPNKQSARNAAQNAALA